MKLGTLLLRNAAIGLSQLESALRNQVLYGGRLGTNLVELGFVDLDVLSGALGELTGLPVATPTLLDAAEPGLLSKIGADEAHRQRAIPLGEVAPGVLSVAMVDPYDADAAARMAELFGMRITPHVVPELRALYYLEKLFGLPRRARFVRSGRASRHDGGGAADEPGTERRRSQPVQGLVTPPALTVEPRRRRSSSHMPMGEAPPMEMSYAAACERVDGASHRDQIGDTLVAYAKGRCAALIAFMIRDGNALGWRGYVAPPGFPTIAFEELSLPLGGVSSLQTAHDTGDAYLGPPLSEGKPVETQLWKELGISVEPTSVLVVPIMVRQRAVNLIYAHTIGSPPETFVTELCALADRMQAAYLRLIKHTRGS